MCPNNGLPTQAALDALVLADHAPFCNSTIATVIAQPFVDNACDDYTNVATRQDRSVAGQSCPLPGVGWLSNLCYQNFSLDAQGQCSISYVAVFNNWWRERSLWCPYPSSWEGAFRRCYAPLFQPFKGLTCPVQGNPVVVTSGNKFERETDFVGGQQSAGLEFVRTYSSQLTLSASSPPAVTSWPIGAGWRHSYERQISAHPNGIQFTAKRADGRYIYFEKVGSAIVGERDEKITLTRQTDGTFRVRNEANEIEHYDVDGRLTAIHGPDYIVTLSYDAWARLLSVTNQNGRSLTFGYANATDQRIVSVTLPDGSPLQFGYFTDGGIVGALASVTHANGYVRSYVYSNQLSGYPSYWLLLTEKWDNGVLESSFEYETDGNKAGAYMPVVSRVTKPRENAVWDFIYDSSGLRTTVQRPAPTPGSPRLEISFEYELFLGKYKLTRQTDGCPSCGSSQMRETVYSNGLPTRTIDARGTATALSVDAGELERVRVEASGLDSQPALARTDERKVETDWHASWRKPTARRTYYCEATGNTADPCTTATSTRWRLETTMRYAYNSRGQLTASCAIDPAVAAATSYTCGASTNAPIGVRQTRHTYCESTATDFGTATCPFAGALKQSNGARTDVTDTVTRQYYAADDSSCASTPATCPYRKGDLWKVTNAVSQVTEFLAYDGAGRSLRQKDANGVITDLSYNNRGWLRTRSVRANADGTPNATLDAVTELEYASNGDIQRVIQPDGSGLEYCRDAARRITAVTQTTRASTSRCSGSAPIAGAEAIIYTLDALGNRLKEEVRDSNGATRRLLARQYNTLSQLRALVNAPYASAANLDDPSVKKTAHVYDANGNMDLTTDPLGRVSDNDYDPLNRLIQSIQDKDTAAATGEIQATVKYEYDARDHLRKVIDPKNLATEYVYDGLGNQTSLVSPDTGTTSYTFDSAGNRKNQTDARGIVTDYTYDALNRLKTIGYPAEATKNITFTYDTVQSGCLADESASKGRLVRIVDQTGQTRLCFDLRGNLRRKVQVTGGRTLTTEYRYNLANRLVGMTYPSGLVVTYTRDTQGRISTVGLSRGSYSLPLVTSVSYLPFGPVGQINFGNGQSLNKAWDQNYWPDAVTGSALDYDFTTNKVGNITEVASVAEGTQKLGYDRLDRLNEVRAANLALIEAYTYDATGNRLSQQIGANSVTSYSYAAQNHRLTQVGAAARSFDAVGNTLTGVPGYETDTASYDVRNRLTQVATGASAQLLNNYNGRGERVLASQGAPAPALPTTSAAWTTSGGVRGFVYDEAGQVISMLIAGNPLRYEEIVWLDNTPIGRVESSTSAVTAVHAIHSDHLNTPRALANAQTQGGQPAGTVVWRWKLNQQTASGSNAFGAQAASENPDGNGTSVRFDLRFPGQQSDVAVGLNYNYFRDYEPGTGRYVESDPIGLWGGLSTYGYVLGQPLNRYDPKGLEVQICCRPADIAGGMIDHCWVRTDTVIAGMGANPNIPPGQEYEGYGVPVFINDHSKDTPTHCTTMNNVNETCVNNNLQIGQPIGRFIPPLNSCQSFAFGVVNKCRTGPQSP